VDAQQEGVVIEEIESGSPAQMVGFQRGDVILDVNGQKITRTRELERLTQNPQRVWRLQIGRGGQVISTVLGG
jgi:S1-C subfamily serine protease